MLRSLEFGITPERVINAIDKLLKYTTVEDSIIKDWIESTDYVKTLREVDEAFDSFMKQRGDEGYVHASRVYRMVKM